MLPKCDAVRSPLATALHATQPDKYALPAWAYTGYTASFLYPSHRMSQWELPNVVTSLRRMSHWKLPNVVTDLMLMGRHCFVACSST